MNMILTLDTDSNASQTTQVFQMLRQRISSGQLAAGEQLPPVSSLSRMMRIPRSVVLRAYEQLAETNMIKKRDSQFVVKSHLQTDEQNPGHSTRVLSESGSDNGLEWHGVYSADRVFMHCCTGEKEEWVRLTLCAVDSKDAAGSRQCKLARTWLEETSDEPLEPAALLTELNRWLSEQNGIEVPPLHAATILYSPKTSTIRIAEAGNARALSNTTSETPADSWRRTPGLAELPDTSYKQSCFPLARDELLSLVTPALIHGQNRWGEAIGAEQFKAELSAVAALPVQERSEALQQRLAELTGRELDETASGFMIINAHQDCTCR
jgi:DNA-binding transcriptional regulator YhcF (GntR family)